MSPPLLRHYHHALLLMYESQNHTWLSIGESLERHPFSGLLDSAGELLHTP